MVPVEQEVCGPQIRSGRGLLLNLGNVSVFLFADYENITENVKASSILFGTLYLWCQKIWKYLTSHNDSTSNVKRAATG